MGIIFSIYRLHMQTCYYVIQFQPSTYEMCILYCVGASTFFTVEMKLRTVEGSLCQRETFYTLHLPHIFPM